MGRASAHGTSVIFPIIPTPLGPRGEEEEEEAACPPPPPPRAVLLLVLSPILPLPSALLSLKSA